MDTRDASYFIVLGASKEETDPVRDLAPEYLRGISLLGISLSVFETGVGLIDSAINTTRILLDAKARIGDYYADSLRVVFIGSCGLISSEQSPTDRGQGTHLKILDTVSASSAAMVDSSLSDGRAFLPPVVHTEVTSTIRFGGLPVEGFYSPLGITRDSRSANSILNHCGRRLENLEIFGVARASVTLGIPWTAVSCITNHVGPGGHEEWLAHHKEAALITTNALSEVLQTEHQLIPRQKTSLSGRTAGNIDTV